MKTLIASVLLVIAISTPSSGQTVDHAVRIKRVLKDYDNYTQIKPVLVNEGTRSIYLEPIRQGMATVHRFDQATRQWWQWGGLSECGVGRGKIIEIKPGEEHEIFVNWGEFMVDAPPAGSYNLIVGYSAEPWSVGHAPEIYSVESGKFRLAGAKPTRKGPKQSKDAVTHQQ